MENTGRKSSRQKRIVIKHSLLSEKTAILRKSGMQQERKPAGWVELQLRSAYSKTHRPCFFISSYIASGARSISPGHMTAPYSK